MKTILLSIFALTLITSCAPTPMTNAKLASYSKPYMKMAPPVQQDPLIESFRQKITDPAFQAELNAIATMQPNAKKRCQIADYPIPEEFRKKYNMKITTILISGNCDSKGRLIGPVIMSSRTTMQVSSTMSNDSMTYFKGNYKRGKQEGPTYSVTNSATKGTVSVTTKAYAAYNFKNGAPNGKYASYILTPMSNMFSHATMRNGKVEGVMTTYTGNQLSQVATWKNGKLNGTSKGYQNGRVASITPFKNGVIHGKMIVKKPDGSDLMTMTYVNGKQVSNNMNLPTINLGKQVTVTQPAMAAPKTTQAPQSSSLAGQAGKAAADCLKRKAAAKACSFLPWPASMACPSSSCI